MSGDDYTTDIGALLAEQSGVPSLAVMNSGGFGARPTNAHLTTPSFTFSTRSIVSEGAGYSAPPHDSLQLLGDDGSGFADRFASLLGGPLPPSLRDTPNRRRSNETFSYGAQKGYGTPMRSKHYDPVMGMPSPGLGSSRPPSRPRSPTVCRSAVHEALFQESRVIKQYKEALREEAVRKELSSLRSPKISRYAMEKEEMRTRRGDPQDVVARMEERVRASKEKKALRAEEIRSQKERQDALLLEAADANESFAESIDGEDAVLGTRGDGRRRGEDGRRGADEPQSGKVSRSRSMNTPSAKRRGTSAKPPPRSPFQPRLTGKGRRAMSKVTAPEFLTGWRHRQDQRVDHRRTETMMKEVADCQEAPEITRRSKALAAKANERDGLVGLTPLEVMLERDRLRKIAQWERRQIQEAEENLFNPRITVYAATLGLRGGEDAIDGGVGTPSGYSAASTTAAQRAQMPVSERLYSDAFALEERRVAKMREQERATAENRRRESLVQRNIRVRGDGDGLSGAADAAARLLERHARDKDAAAQRMEVLRSEMAGPHQPRINPVSEAITARLPHSSSDRLLSGHRSMFERAPAAVPSRWDDGEGGNSGGGINRKVFSRDDEQRFAQKLATYEEKRRDKLRNLKLEREEEAMAECTFAPLVHNGVPEEAPAREGLAATPAPEGSVDVRTQQWMLRRDAKVEALREVAEAQRADYTFAPQLSRSRSRPADENATIYGDGIPWGSQEHVRRQEASRRLKEAMEERLTGRPKPAALGRAPSNARDGSRHPSISRGADEGIVRRSGSRKPSGSLARDCGSAARLNSLQPPVLPQDVRALLGYDDYASPRPATPLQERRREYEHSLAGNAQPTAPPQPRLEVREPDTYIAQHSTGILIPPSMW